MGICMGLSFISRYNPASFKAWTTATLAWNRFIPYQTERAQKKILCRKPRARKTYLEPLARMMIERPIIVEYVDKI